MPAVCFLSILNSSWQCLKAWFPPATWYSGSNVTDGLYNIETVVLRQNNVIEKGREKCHHLSVCIVGHERSGKSSLIRNLTGQQFEPNLKPTKLIETQMLSPPVKIVAENLVKAQTWQICEDEGDVEELISETVRRSLNEGYSRMRGKAFCGLHVNHYMKLLLMVFLTLLVLTLNLLHGEKMMIGVMILMAIGYLLFAVCDPAVRMSIGCFVLMIVIIYYHGYLMLTELDRNQANYDAIDQTAILCKSMFAAIVWGLVASKGMNTGVAAGLATFDLKKANVDTKRILNFTSPQLFTALTQLSSFELDIHCAKTVLYYFGGLAIMLLIAYIVGNFCCRRPLRLLCIIICFGAGFLLSWKVELTGLARVAFSAFTVLLCLITGITSLSFEKRSTEMKKAAGLKRVDILNSWIFYHIPGVVLACVFSWHLLEWPFAITSVSNLIDRIAAVMFVSIVSRSSSIAEYFGYVPITSVVTQAGGLPSYFKLIVRDFAGQAQYHTMHQPFLPKLGIFVCVFSWNRAKDHEEECLREIMFWLKNVAVHKERLQYENDALAEKDIKNIILVGTHSETCGLNRQAKDTIISRYMKAIEEHPNINSCIERDIDRAGIQVLDIENSQEGRDIELLKSFLLECSKQVIETGFKQPLAVASWCWLRDQRSKIKDENLPPYARYVDVLDSFKWPSSYEKESVLNEFSNIGEIFIIEQISSQTPHRRSRNWEGSYLFFNMQFIIDFMNNLANIDDKKTREQKNGQKWKNLRKTGKENVELLVHYVRSYHESKKMQDPFRKRKTEHPLIQTLVHMDFIFVIRSQFFIPQHLPECKLSGQPLRYQFRSPQDILWEYVFDFGDFIYHHQYVFYSLVARLANTYDWSLTDHFKQWVSFNVRLVGERDETWFTLTCTKSHAEQAAKHSDNTIRVRMSESFRAHYDESLKIKECIAGAIEDIIKQRFINLNYTEQFNCPRREKLESRHYIPSHLDDAGVRCERTSICRPCDRYECIRLAAGNIPYVGVSPAVVQFLCKQDALQLSSNLGTLLAHLRDRNKKTIMADFPSSMVPPDKIEDQLNKWIKESTCKAGERATLDKILEALEHEQWAQKVRGDLKKEFFGN